MTVDVLPAADLGRFHREFYLPNRPAIIRGLPEFTRSSVFDWSARYFEERLGDKVVPVMATRQSFLSYERNFQHMPFRDFVGRMHGPDPEGMRYYFKNPTNLLPDGHDPRSPIAELERYTHKAVSRNLWISGSGLTVGLHFDAADNLNFQLRGSKSFTIYPPGVTPFYPLSMFSQTANISGVFRNGPTLDRERFPLFEPNAGRRIELQQGDVLYIPAYWWHQVESLGSENLNLNYWWLPQLRKQAKNVNQAIRGHLQVLQRLIKYGNIQQAPADTRPAGNQA